MRIEVMTVTAHVTSQGGGQAAATASCTRYFPPKGALIDWFTPPEDADDRIHALLTAYERWVQKYGVRTAGRIFLVQSIGVVFGFWVYWLCKHINLLKSFGRPPDSQPTQHNPDIAP
jgi:hypothetical protein